jgi:hypothetical protein
LVGVFADGDVADVVGAVFDGFPVIAYVGGDLWCRGPLFDRGQIATSRTRRYMDPP